MKKIYSGLLAVICLILLLSACSKSKKTDLNEVIAPGGDLLVADLSGEDKPDLPVTSPRSNRLTLPSYSRKLTSAEFISFLHAMGITSLSVPKSFGTPYLAVDWNLSKKTADSGRSITLGFTNLFQDYNGGWGRGYINYQTYNFSLGTEYDTFFRKEEFSTFHQDTSLHLMKVGTVTGIVKYEWRDFTQELRKIVVFPFKDHYLDLVFSLKGNFSSNHDQVIKDLYDGKYPENNKQNLIDFDNLTKSIEFAITQ